VLERAQVVAQVELARGLDAGDDAWFGHGGSVAFFLRNKKHPLARWLAQGV